MLEGGETIPYGYAKNNTTRMTRSPPVSLSLYPRNSRTARPRSPELDELIRPSSQPTFPFQPPTDTSLCVWAAGTGPRELTKTLIASIPEQASSKPGGRGRLLVDPYMRVKVRCSPCVLSCLLWEWDTSSPLFCLLCGNGTRLGKHAICTCALTGHERHDHQHGRLHRGRRQPIAGHRTGTDVRSMFEIVSGRN